MWMQVQNELGSDPVPWWIFVTLIPRSRWPPRATCCHFWRAAAGASTASSLGGGDIADEPILHQSVRSGEPPTRAVALGPQVTQVRSCSQVQRFRPLSFQIYLSTATAFRPAHKSSRLTCLDRFSGVQYQAGAGCPSREQNQSQRESVTMHHGRHADPIWRAKSASIGGVVTWGNEPTKIGGF